MMADRQLISILQRHGSTVLNEDNKFRGRMDPPLDDQGLQQAETAAEAVANSGVQRIVSSPLLRALQTADIIAQKLGLNVEQDRGLISWDLGFLNGRDKDIFKDILNLYVDNPKLVVPDGEALESLEQRTFEFFDKELKNGQVTLYVTHTSNIITVENLIHGNHDGRPESGETTVEPGGSLGVFLDSEGNYSTEVLFGIEKEATFGS
jgi:broad specificity phosphatase PhoE